MTADEWCEDKIAPEGECFRGEIPPTMDHPCKCADHTCHNGMERALLKKKRDEL
jgi:hypothetical protein